MTEPDTDMLDHLGTMREEKNEPSCFECDFAFAFNNTNFSYRLLTIEVIPDPHFVRTQPHSLPTIANWTRNCKRRRQRVRKHFANANDVLLHREEQVNCNLPEAEEAVGMIEGSPSGDEVFHGNDSSLGMSWSKVLRVRTMHISSPILAAKSPFFYKLFSNGMKVRATKCDSLNPCFCNNLSRTTSSDVLDVLMAANKFEVASCIRYCSRMLRKMPMTYESALLYLDLPSSILMADAVQPLIEAAKLFLATHYRGITKFANEALNLPLAGIEAVLSSDDLQTPDASSEDAVFDFVLKWARIHYPK